LVAFTPVITPTLAFQLAIWAFEGMAYTGPPGSRDEFQ